MSESSCIANVAAPLRVADVRCDAVTGVWTLQLPDGVSGDGLPTAGPPTAGPLLPSLPSGAVLDLEQRRLEGDGNVGYRLWRSAGAMCRWMRRNEGAVRGARVLELGAGTGAVGIFAAALGARLGRHQADPTLLPVMRRGMEQLAIRDADTRLAQLLEGLVG